MDARANLEVLAKRKLSIPAGNLIPTFHTVAKHFISMGYGLDGQGPIPCRAKRFSLLHSVQTGSGAQQASYAMGTGASFPST
jgi:hypothetical protein